MNSEEQTLAPIQILEKITDFGAHWIRLWSPTPEQRVEELNVTSPTQGHTETSARGLEDADRSPRSRRLLKKRNTSKSSTHCMQRLTTSVKLEESRTLFQSNSPPQYCTVGR